MRIGAVIRGAYGDQSMIEPLLNGRRAWCACPLEPLGRGPAINSQPEASYRGAALPASWPVDGDALFDALIAPRRRNLADEGAQGTHLSDLDDQPRAGGGRAEAPLMTVRVQVRDTRHVAAELALRAD